MIRSLLIDGYRGFRQLTLSNLGRVNLIVGTNNAGKTSVLEAIHILETVGELWPIWATLTRRGEDFEERMENRVQRHVEVRRLFNEHDASRGNSWGVRAETEHGTDHFSMHVTEREDSPDTGTGSLFDGFESSGLPPWELTPAALQLSWKNSLTGESHSTSVNINRRGGFGLDAVSAASRAAGSSRIPVRFVSAASLSPDTVIDFFEDIVLTDAEDFVTNVLRVIEPRIERIATSGTDRRRIASGRAGQRGGLLVKCEGMSDRIPIGSMGDGIWRLLGLALAMTQSTNGILLVDEIDGGLHHSVMEKMWKVVSGAAKGQNTQVFATTHSRDCFESLAAVSRDSVSANSEVTIQRIERNNEAAVSYTEQEIVAAARRHIEVR